MKAQQTALMAKRDIAAAIVSASYEPQAIAGLHRADDELTSAGHGTLSYAGSVILLLSGALLRFKDDAEATPDEWDKSSPLFNGCSFGRVIVAAANGVRHDDEWAKTPSTAKQKNSQEILSKALAGKAIKPRTTPGSTVEITDLSERRWEL